MKLKNIKNTKQLKKMKWEKTDVIFFSNTILHIVHRLFSSKSEKLVKFPPHNINTNNGTSRRLQSSIIAQRPRNANY